MSNVSYDLDTSGGLMPLIRALIKPPDEDVNNTKLKKPQHPYYKRPGKGHNHDTCDACGEGGDLICCDRCPASFHLGCYDPPLDENDIPAGQWLCKQCHGADAEKSTSSRSSRAQSPADKSDTEKNRSRSLRRNRQESTAQSKKKKDDKDQDSAADSGESTKKVEEEKEPNPMEILIKAAKIMNPKQFELPREMMVPCPFPGTERENGNGCMLTTVDAWGCVPIPTKLCFVCEETCKKAPLLHCDYCPLLFHQDCLDPPMTALPIGRWMCPNHVEQYIDWKMVNSISAMERVALWDKFSGPVDQDEIKLDFIRRARNPAPLFRTKIPVESRKRVAVPSMVAYHYEHPPALMPSRREFTRCSNVMKRLKLSDEYVESDEDDTRVHQICMNLDCPNYAGTGPCPCEDRTPDEAEDITQHVILEGDDDTKDPMKKKAVSCKVTLADSETASLVLDVARKQLRNVDDKLVKLLAYQQLQEILHKQRCIGPWRSESLTPEVEELIERSIDKSKLTQYGFRHVALPSQLLSEADARRIACSVWGAPPSPAPLPPPAPRPREPLRAALQHVLTPNSGGLGDGLGRAVGMRLSTLTVGTRAELALSRFGSCRRASEHHATIFYDEVTRNFELLNYSNWGTVINGVLYALELSERAEPEPPLRAVVSKPLQVKGDLTTDQSRECRCGAAGRARDAAAWEGSAILSHGDLIQFGCIQFVFAVIQQ